ncbi:MOSC domain-containing protein [Cryobacterium sp. PH31-AA6]|uniref:MOSC domain-containing protein n=1 Tax=Cryobacterium sp. PH31-AA6 TaxID=3046205 RepID=UPI0024B8DE06|nr:MOSC domain-containing protein [Cryobacterium sp. PH31-AA6]MDJ0324737.1 MOSC domain-containing protein [Cryobacterium sp. PH31-AA6]
MQISTIGVSALKGGRHRSRDQIRLEPDGPVGDRVFAVVDLEAGRVVRTIEQPSLLGCEARWGSGVLSVEIDGEWISAEVEPSGNQVALDYWGRTARMEVIEGPWASEFSRFLGRRVVLARSAVPGTVVFGGSVTIATSGSLNRLAAESGTMVDARRFRSTLTIDTGDAAAHVEDAWIGRELEIGTARLRVSSGVPRCAVIDLDPDTGVSGTSLLKTLAGYRLRAGEIEFGVYAEVIRPGIVSGGDLARVLPAAPTA